MMTLDDLRRVMPVCPPERAATFYEHLAGAMEEFKINTAHREAAFLAQVAHESGELRYVRELADGTAYEGRADLGNTEPGDGPRFKGRGLIQITGRANYRTCGVALSLPLEREPEILEQVGPACRSAAWYWNSRRLNDPADKLQFGTITRKINGGFNGIDDRAKYWARALIVLMAPVV